jgi:hypothetical protein
LATTKDPKQAALIYDIVLLQTKGMMARVNFNYSARELLGILFSEPLHKLKMRSTLTGDNQSKSSNSEEE